MKLLYVTFWMNDILKHMEYVPDPQYIHISGIINRTFIVQNCVILTCYQMNKPPPQSEEG